MAPGTARGPRMLTTVSCTATSQTSRLALGPAGGAARPSRKGRVESASAGQKARAPRAPLGLPVWRRTEKQPRCFRSNKGIEHEQGVSTASLIRVAAGEKRRQVEPLRTRDPQLGGGPPGINRRTLDRQESLRWLVGHEFIVVSVVRTPIRVK